MMKIPVKYRIPLTGTYNRGVYICPDCGADMINSRHKYGSVFDNAIGFADTNMGMVMIVECSKCFTHWYSHAGNNMIYFLDSIESGKQKHFKH